MRDVTISDLERLGETAEPVDVAFQMDEDTFRSFYDRTARLVWAYLSRATADKRLADDLLQETYYRFLRAGATFDSESHRRRYLFRIAVNLVHDHHRRLRLDRLSSAEAGHHQRSPADAETTARAAARIDLKRALARLKPRERDLLWLAYALGSSHEEIAASLGLKTGSIKALLFRARRRLVSLLGHAYAPMPDERASCEDE
jgi:RNA polymerase sigma-70 factor (ECF subfamily)